MEPAEYQALVADLEEVAAGDPDVLRQRVYTHIAIGYGYVLAVLLLLVGTTIGVVVFMLWTRTVYALWKLVAALLVACGAIVRAFWVRIEPPTGRPLTREDAPRLYERVEATCAALNAPRPDVLLLDDGFNASVANIPRLGIFGLSRIYLTVGLPLMYALTPEQFDAVLAHEFGHLSRAHPKHGLRVHHIGMTWQQLVDTMHKRRSAALILFAHFFEWFIPRLRAYGAVMSRADEYAADSDGARATSPAAMGGALVALDVRGKALTDDFWPGVFARAEREADPPAGTWRGIPDALRASDVHEARSARVALALRAQGSDTDTHPPLRERLQALALVRADVEPSDLVHEVDALLTPLDVSAAVHYLGSFADHELAACDARWRERAMRDWREIFKRAEARRRRLAELAVAQAADALSRQELIELMNLTAGESGGDAALPLARRILTDDDASAEAHYLIGQVLLHNGDVEGVRHVLRAMELDDDAVAPGAQLLYSYYQERNDAEGMAEMERRFEDRRAQLEEAQRERAEVLPSDEFEPPSLDAATERGIRDGVRRTDGIRSVIVTCKRTKHTVGRPLLVLTILRTRFAWSKDDADRNIAQELLERITAPMPDLIVLAGNSQHRKLAEGLRKRGLAVELRP